MKRLLTLILVLTLLLSLLCACGGGEETGTTAQTKANEETGTEERELTDIEKRALTKDALPDSLDYGGAEFRTYAFKEMYDLDVNGTDAIGDMVTDSVFERNCSVEERLHVTFDNVKSSAGRFEDFGKEVNILATSGSKEYHAIFTMGNSVIQGGYTDSFRDVTDLPYISDSPWWWANAMREVSFDVNHQKFLIGDICLSAYTRCGIMLVNIPDYESYFHEGINELYQLVLDRKWTVDELKTRVKQAYVDINGDGVDLNDEGDYLGLCVANPEMIKFLEYAFDIERYSRDEDGCAILKYDVARASEAADALIDLIFETEGVHWQENYADSKDFTQGRTLFQVSWLSALLNENMRNMEEEYTIVPLPMLDAKQTEYRTNIQNSAEMVGVLTPATDLEYISAVLEALGAESYRNVVLPFYEVALKIRYAKESGVGKMIDIITSVATKNFLYEYQAGSGCGVLVTSVVQMEVNKVASEYEKRSVSTIEYLRKLKVKEYPELATE